MRAKLIAIIGSLVIGATTPAWAQTASLVLLNGKIWTENPKAPEVTALAVQGNRIVAVGDTAKIRAMVGSTTLVIDLKGRRVTPGFNDAHVHFFFGGAALASVQLSDAKSPGEFRQRVADYTKTLPSGVWIRYGIWDHQQWAHPDLPTHQLIDDISPENPAFLWRSDGHMVLANAAAMKLAGVDRNTKDVPGGEILRDAGGAPTGIFKDAATALIERAMPPLSDREMEAALHAAMTEAARHGVTSVQNMMDSPGDPHGPAYLRRFQAAERRGELTVRIYSSSSLRTWSQMAETGLMAPVGDPTLRIGLLKSFADGAIGSTTAWMDEPFVGKPGNVGLASPDLQARDEMLGRMVSADSAGLQLAIHAIGTRANRELLDMFEVVAKKNGPSDHRFRIEHAQHLNPADIPRFAKLGVVASMQPYHAIDDGRWVTGVIGPERARYSYAWKSLLDADATLAFGSDWPVAPLDALMGIYAAVTRQTLDGKSPGGWIPEQRISVAQAVHAYTMGSAYAEFQDKIKGSLEPGKLADLVILSQDIFSIPPDQIAKTKVEMTIFDGRVVYAGH